MRSPSAMSVAVIKRALRVLLTIEAGSRPLPSLLARGGRRLLSRILRPRMILAVPARVADHGRPVPLAPTPDPDDGEAPGAVLVEDVLTGGSKNEAVLRGDGTLLMNDVEFEHFSPAFFKVPHRFYAAGALTLIEDPRPVGGIEHGIYLGSFAFPNWFHFVTRAAAGAVLLRRLPAEYRDWPVLLPDAPLPPASERLLDAVLEGRPVIRFPRFGLLGVDRLVWMRPAAHGLNHLRPEGPDLVPFDVHLPTFRELRRIGLGLLDGERRTPPRVFLDRGESDSRPYNRDEVMAVLDGFGFQPVRMDLLPLEEQVRIMAGAEVAVGPTGAGWTNALWMRPGARGLYWIPRHLAGFRGWTALAGVGGATIRPHAFDAEGSRFFEAPYRLDTARLAADVRRLVDR